MDKVFVYGTLRKGESNHHLLQQALYLGQCQIQGRYQLFNLGYYPALVDAEHNRRIAGEVYQVSAQELAQLDILEEYPSLYRREPVETQHGRAWVYLYNHNVDSFPLIEDGDWCHRS
ncbi:gamma-glutamylcyclotransferase [Photobacterium sanctipauli]|uniref:Gamma-glutamylcyclotransferase family protein n=1 Tax=Photobacterium sanctipauli TaxID=1342794 RepID=A0A2T3NIY4_9GAMM|nr:gamma-glutamylcyclotransferase family protein [Photobacterium sanctipauli]PSW15180.1 gamma-glutamylcyclotransferase [Photobacterium sanctipauli]